MMPFTALFKPNHSILIYILGFLPKTVIAKTVLPLPVQILNNTSPEIPCVTRDNTTTRCVIGRFNGKDVYFPNVFDAGYTSFVNDKLFGLETELVEKYAVYLHDVAPTDQNEEDFGCQEFDFVPKGCNIFARKSLEL